MPVQAFIEMVQQYTAIVTNLLYFLGNMILLNSIVSNTHLTSDDRVAYFIKIRVILRGD